jgi:formate hydrogenlyase subunit 6/NADH:ubiquinone oxidoreductase subunit I
MKIGSMFRDVSASLFRAPATERYPFERRPAPARLRGRLIWNPQKCTGCGLCATDCPARAIEVLVLDKKAKRFVFHYQVDNCTFCAQCVHSCRQDSLDLSDEAWELAALDRDAFALYYGDETDVREVLAGDVSTDAGPPGDA